MYRIEWHPKARRQLKKIRDHKVRIAIYDAVDTLQDWPRCRNVKALQNRPGYRLRVGKWRVIFDVERYLEIIAIEEVKKTR